MSQSKNLASGGVLGQAARKQLAGYAKRVGSLMDEKVEIDDGIKEVFKEAGDAGFDKKILRKAIKRVRTDPASAQAEEDMIDSYVEAIQQPDLFQAASGGDEVAEKPAAPAHH